MLMDSRLDLCDATSLNTGAANTYLIGSQVYLGAGCLYGDPTDLWWVINVDTAVDSSGDGVTLTFKLASDDSAAVSTTTSTVLVTSPTFTQATLAKGFVWATKLPVSTTVPEAYLGVLQTTAVEAVTAGKINSYLTTKVPTSTQLMNFPDGVA